MYLVLLVQLVVVLHRQLPDFCCLILLLEAVCKLLENSTKIRDVVMTVGNAATKILSVITVISTIICQYYFMTGDILT